MGHPLPNFWQQKIDRVRSGQSYDVIRGPASDQFFKEVFSAMKLAAIDKNGDIMHDLGQHTNTSDL